MGLFDFIPKEITGAAQAAVGTVAGARDAAVSGAGQVANAGIGAATGLGSTLISGGQSLVGGGQAAIDQANRIAQEAIENANRELSRQQAVQAAREAADRAAQFAREEAARVAAAAQAAREALERAASERARQQAIRDSQAQAEQLRAAANAAITATASAPQNVANYIKSTPIPEVAQQIIAAPINAVKITESVGSAAQKSAQQIIDQITAPVAVAKQTIIDNPIKIAAATVATAPQAGNNVLDSSRKAAAAFVESGNKFIENVPVLNSVNKLGSSVTAPTPEKRLQDLAAAYRLASPETIIPVLARGPAAIQDLNRQINRMNPMVVNAAPEPGTITRRDGSPIEAPSQPAATKNILPDLKDFLNLPKSFTGAISDTVIKPVTQGVGGYVDLWGKRVASEPQLGGPKIVSGTGAAWQPFKLGSQPVVTIKEGVPEVVTVWDPAKNAFVTTTPTGQTTTTSDKYSSLRLTILKNPMKPVKSESFLDQVAGAVSTAEDWVGGNIRNMGENLGMGFVNPIDEANKLRVPILDRPLVTLIPVVGQALGPTLELANRKGATGDKEKLPYGEYSSWSQGAGDTLGRFFKTTPEARAAEAEAAEAKGDILGALRFRAAEAVLRDPGNIIAMAESMAVAAPVFGVGEGALASGGGKVALRLGAKETAKAGVERVSGWVIPTIFTLGIAGEATKNRETGDMFTEFAPAKVSGNIGTMAPYLTSGALGAGLTYRKAPIKTEGKTAVPRVTTEVARIGTIEKISRIIRGEKDLTTPTPKKSAGAEFPAGSPERINAIIKELRGSEPAKPKAPKAEPKGPTKAPTIADITQTIQGDAPMIDKIISADKQVSDLRSQLSSNKPLTEKQLDFAKQKNAPIQEQIKAANAELVKQKANLKVLNSKGGTVAEFAELAAKRDAAAAKVSALNKKLMKANESVIERQAKFAQQKNAPIREQIKPARAELVKEKLRVSNLNKKPGVAMEELASAARDRDIAAKKVSSLVDQLMKAPESVVEKQAKFAKQKNAPIQEQIKAANAELVKQKANLKVLNSKGGTVAEFAELAAKRDAAAAKVSALNKKLMKANESVIERQAKFAQQKNAPIKEQIKPARAELVKEKIRVRNLNKKPGVTLEELASVATERDIAAKKVSNLVDQLMKAPESVVEKQAKFAKQKNAPIQEQIKAANAELTKEKIRLRNLNKKPGVTLKELAVAAADRDVAAKVVSDLRKQLVPRGDFSTRAAAFAKQRNAPVKAALKVARAEQVRLRGLLRELMSKGGSSEKTDKLNAKIAAADRVVSDLKSKLVEEPQKPTTSGSPGGQPQGAQVQKLKEPKVEQKVKPKTSEAAQKPQTKTTTPQARTKVETPTATGVTPRYGGIYNVQDYDSFGTSIEVIRRPVSREISATKVAQEVKTTQTTSPIQVSFSDIASALKQGELSTNKVEFTTIQGQKQSQKQAQKQDQKQSQKQEQKQEQSQLSAQTQKQAQQQRQEQKQKQDQTQRQWQDQMTWEDIVTEETTRKRPPTVPRDEPLPKTPRFAFPGSGQPGSGGTPTKRARGHTKFTETVAVASTTDMLRGISSTTEEFLRAINPKLNGFHKPKATIIPIKGQTRAVVATKAQTRAAEAPKTQTKAVKVPKKQTGTKNLPGDMPLNRELLRMPKSNHI